MSKPDKPGEFREKVIRLDGRAGKNLVLHVFCLKRIP